MPNVNNFKLSSNGKSMIENFEGCVLTGYADAVNVPTVGYGHTGPDVAIGMKITQKKADQLFDSDISIFTDSVNNLVKVPLTQNAFDALVSFAYNEGIGGLAKSSLLEKLNNKDYAGAANVFDLYIYAGNNILEGLKTRRAREKALFLDGINVVSNPVLPQTASKFPSVPTADKKLPDINQMRLFCPGDQSTNFVVLDSQAKRDLVDYIAKGSELPYTIDRVNNKTYLAHSSTAKPIVVSPIYGSGLPDLPVKYYSQRDSQINGQALRMCFSSSCAMLVNYLKPGVLSGDNGDDQYLQTVLKYGDTISGDAQIKALNFYGVKAEFRQDLDFSAIDNQLKKGIPVPVGFLHHGNIDAPSGDGHYLLITGETKDSVIVNDPYGEIDLVTGVYQSTDGHHKSYSMKNFGRRWMVDQNGNYVSGMGWGIIAL